MKEWRRCREEDQRLRWGDHGMRSQIVTSNASVRRFRIVVEDP